jgi:chloramphenicol-sensitive protein RarD
LSSPTPLAPESSQRPEPWGLTYGFAAYLTWGIVPIYFKAVSVIPAGQVLAHRIVWSTVTLLALTATTGALKRLRTPRALGFRARTLLLTTLLVSTNWLLYIWAVEQNRMVEASLGYFINPLVNVALGVLFLGERLNSTQRAACLLALVGVAFLTVSYGSLPLLSLGLALSFGLYGLLRKRAGVDPTLGLFAETTLLFPLALAYLGWLAAHGALRPAGGEGRLWALIAMSGVITSTPLIWFNEAVRKLPLSTLGLLQYLSPSCQLLLAVLVYREPFLPAYQVAFAFIWASLALYTWDGYRRARSLGSARSTRVTAEPS